MHLSNRTQTIQTIIIIFLLAWIAIISPHLASITPPTSDEYTFIPSGYTYWKTGDFRMNTEQPPLIKLFNTIPLLFMNVNLPLEHTSWSKAQLFGRDGFYQYFIFEANNDKKEILLFATRAMNVLFAIALGILILCWTTELFGRLAGTFALAMYALEPTILAYSSLFMMEIGFSFFSTLSLYTFWKFLNKPTKKTFILAAIALGLVQLTKHTAIFFIGIY
ncbi:phospholipid carrier-dependent glycosyltransferase, partial [Candidatus Woesearchaeota archaeon]|nr:phospholipid carrier-dependent glycosyltransferase [Candidatus Woesearchaeota archaeon]